VWLKGYIRVIIPALLLNQFRFNGYAFLSLYNTIFVNDPQFYKPFSFVQFQRSATENHYRIFEHYTKNIRSQLRSPIIYEIDDMLFNIPKWNYASDYYAPTEDIIKKMMSLCDGMTVSTEALKEAYSPYCKKITVIPNHLPKFLWGESIIKDKPRELKDRPRIGWMGSENHFVHPATKQYKEGIRGGDFGEKLLEFIRKTVDVYQWVLSGAKPVELVDLIDTKKIEFHSWKSILEYPTHARALDLDIGIAPLYPSNFNDSKSNIKCLEFSHLGLAGVYSAARPYLDMSLNTNDEDEFVSNIEKVASDVDYRLQIHKQDYNTVEDQLYWESKEKLNLKRYVNSYLEMFGKTLKM